MRRAGALLVIVSALAVACGDNEPGASPDAMAPPLPRNVVTVTQMLLPGTVEEGIRQATPTDRIRLYLSASAAAIDWDIHAHANGGTQDVAYAFGQQSGAYDFTPPGDGPWYLLLRNDGDGNVQLDVGMELYGSASWDGFQ